MKECSTCCGYGLWAVGDPVPMGPMDAKDGMPTIPCPECGADYGSLPKQVVKRYDPNTDADWIERLTETFQDTTPEQVKELYKWGKKSDD